MANLITLGVSTDRAINLVIKTKKNDTFSLTITVLENGTAFDLTNYDVATMQVKARKDSSTVVLLLSIADSRLALGGTEGTITFLVAKEDMDITDGTYVYDLEITNTGTGVRETIIEGKFIISADVTRVV